MSKVTLGQERNVPLQAQLREKQTKTKIQAKDNESKTMGSAKKDLKIGQTLSNIKKTTKKRATNDSKEPRTWAEVKQFEEADDANNEEALVTEHDIAQLSELEDPLGLKKQGYKTLIGTIKRKQYQETLDMTREDFKPSVFVAKIYQNASLEDLLLEKQALQKKVYSRQEQLKLLVREHFHRFVQCKDTIDELFTQMKNDLQTNEESQTFIKLEGTIRELKAKAKEIFDPLIERQKEIDSIRNALTILKRFQFLFNLPDIMRENIKRGDYNKVVVNYKNVKALIANTSITMFKNISFEVDTIIKDLRTQLFKSLSNMTFNVNEQVKIIRLLIELGSPEDPAWYCITERCNRVMNTLRDFQPKTTTITSDSSLEDISILEVRQLSSVLEHHIPEIWNVATAFYNGEYHINLPENKWLEIMQKHPEEEFKKLIQTIIQTYCDKISLLFFSTTIKRNVRSKNVSPVIRFSDAHWRDWASQRLPQRFKFVGEALAATKKKRRSSILQSFVDNDKEKLLVVLACYKTLSSSLLPSDYLSSLEYLLHKLTIRFVMQTFDDVLNELNRLHECEDWKVVDDQNMVTSLPLRFISIMDTIIFILAGAIQNNDPILLTVHKKLFECIKVFTDNLHFLAFGEEKSPRQEEMSRRMSIERDARLLLILNNCCYAKQELISQLLQQFNHDFNSSVTFSDGGVATAFDLLEKKVLDKYLKNKIIPLSAIVRNGVLFYSSSNSLQSVPTEISDYVMEILLHLVATYDEVSRFSPKHLSNILSTILESVYQAVLDTVISLTIDNFSTWSRIQIGMDIEFIDTLVGRRFVTSKSGRELCDALKNVLNYPQSINNSQDKCNVQNILENVLQRTKLLFLSFTSELHEEKTQYNNI